MAKKTLINFFILNILYLNLYSTYIVNLNSNINVNNEEKFSQYFQYIPKNSSKILFQSNNRYTININSGGILDFSSFKNSIIEFSKNIAINISKGSKIILNNNQIIFNNIVNIQ